MTALRRVRTMRGDILSIASERSMEKRRTTSGSWMMGARLGGRTQLHCRWTLPFVGGAHAWQV